MSNPDFLPETSVGCLVHLIEECGEVLAAAGKTLRYGEDSYNPLVPIKNREVNRDWLRRELADLKQAIARLEARL